MSKPRFSLSFEQSFKRAFQLANSYKHQYATLEHLLLALIKDRHDASFAADVGVDLEGLHRLLVDYLESDILVTDGTEYPKPSATFDRVIQCAENHVASLGDPEVCGDNVLVAIFAEQESYAANLLQLPGMTHDDALKQYKARERLREMSRRFE